jgi:hypothetical protein
MGVALREFVSNRAGHRCEYCHLPQEFSELTFHLEHVIPRQHGGEDNQMNRALACPECNLLKGTNLTALDPETGKVALLFHPRRQKWAVHFTYQGCRIVGRTAAGRATVSLLDLNSAERLRVRRLLFDLI